jgi:ubiquinone/menaquinone biosynthesis C-methylase UbiE
MQDAVSFHDSLAKTWEAGYDQDTFSMRVRVLSSLLPRGMPGDRWLDAGCGTGTLSRWLARERNFSVLAMDASEQMLMSASPEEGVEYYRADVTQTRLPERSFDGVLCSSVLEYLPSTEGALREFHRILKPGGILVASIPNSALSVQIPVKIVYWLTRPLGRKRWYACLDHSKHFCSAAGFSELLQRCGFSAERTIKFGMLEAPFGIKVRNEGLIMSLAVRR